MRKWFFITLVGVFVWQYVLKPEPPSYSIDTANGLSESELSATGSYLFKGHKVTPLEPFHIKARVLSRKNYSSDREAVLSPLDLALGWGRMSEDDVLKQIKISQSGRWYYWRVDEFPIPRREIETHSANMHLIPADERIAEAIDQVTKDQFIELSGELVRVDAADGWHWVSSLTRNDTGARSCEVVMVKRFKIINL